MEEEPRSDKLIYKELFQDRAMVILFASGFVMATLISLRVLLSINEYDIDIPVRYTQFGSIDTYISGDWYTHYEFIVFAFVTLLINTFIALRIYRHRRWVSLSLLSAQIVISIFLFVISGAIINTLPVVG